MQSFLDLKRAHCPRLYFISDKEMIALYRDASQDIKKTEPYIRKMFKLVLTDEPEDKKPRLIKLYNPLILYFKSADREFVKFHRVMKARCQIEEWIKFLDHYIKTTFILLFRDLKAKAKLKEEEVRGPPLPLSSEHHLRPLPLVRGDGKPQQERHFAGCHHHHNIF